MPVQIRKLSTDEAAKVFPKRGQMDLSEYADALGELQPGEELNEHHIYLTGYVNTDISSTEIRQRVRDGESIEDLVPPRVADYIRKYELYRR